MTQEVWKAPWAVDCPLQCTECNCCPAPRFPLLDGPYAGHRGPVRQVVRAAAEGASLRHPPRHQALHHHAGEAVPVGVRHHRRAHDPRWVHLHAARFLGPAAQRMWGGGGSVAFVCESSGLDLPATVCPLLLSVYHDAWQASSAPGGTSAAPTASPRCGLRCCCPLPWCTSPSASPCTPAQPAPRRWAAALTNAVHAGYPCADPPGCARGHCAALVGVRVLRV
jgi:hypothetical protein